MRPLLLDLPSAAHRETFRLGVEDAKLRLGIPSDEGQAVYLFYEAAKYTWQRYPDAVTYDAMMGLLTLWQRDYCRIGADLTSNTLAIH